MFVGTKGQAHFSVAPVGSEKEGVDIKGKQVPGWVVYEPLKNTALTLSWYKIESGRYEINAYLG
jgi:hypothetical protein